MGQCYVVSVQAGRVPEFISAMGQAGFDVAPNEAGDRQIEAYRCQFGDRRIVLQVDVDGRFPDESLVTLARPPYSVCPWRWPGDNRFFGDIMEVLEGFHYRD